MGHSRTGEVQVCMSQTTNRGQCRPKVQVCMSQTTNMGQDKMRGSGAYESSYKVTAGEVQVHTSQVTNRGQDRRGSGVYELSPCGSTKQGSPRLVGEMLLNLGHMLHTGNNFSTRSTQEQSLIVCFTTAVGKEITMPDCRCYCLSGMVLLVPCLELESVAV